MASPGSFDLWFQYDVWFYFPFSIILQIPKSLTFVSINNICIYISRGKKVFIQKQFELSFNHVTSPRP